MVLQKQLLTGTTLLREVCATKILNNPVEVGGPGTHVEIDESMFVRRKGNVWRLVREQWVFGGICRETRQCFLVAVPDRKKETLFGEICRFIKPQTVIISDCWPGYVGIHEIPGKFYKHLTVNHSQNFVDPDTGADTNLVENMWGRAKVGNRQRRGTHRTMLDSYMFEFMWRQNIGSANPFETIIRDIATQFPQR